MGIDPSAIARTLGIETSYVDLSDGKAKLLPQRIAVIAQGSSAVTYSTVKAQFTSAFAVAQTYGFGSPAHLIAMELWPTNSDGVGTIPVTFYALNDNGSGVAAAGSITPSGTQTAAAVYRARVNGIYSAYFSVAASATVAAICTAMTAAINAVLEMPIIASDDTTEVGVLAKWEGLTGNDIYIEIVGEDLGTTFTTVQPVNGAAPPAIDDALAQIGDVWETMILNAGGMADTDALDALSTFGEGRWGLLTHKPCIAFVGNTEADRATATAVTATRTLDRTNCQLVAPGSVNLPFVVAARQLARIAKVANGNPPKNYGSQRATGLLPGTDGEQWDYPTRDAALKAGSSTIEVRNGVIHLSDIITMYAPEGDPLPAYRNVVDIVKIQNLIYSVVVKFKTDEWDGAPLIPNEQPTTNPEAKKPKMAIAEMALIADELGQEAIIANPKAAKKTITAVISGSNPKRLVISGTFPVAGNTDQLDVALQWGFNFS